MFPPLGAGAAVGGLTCLFLPELSRAAVFDCLRKRRHFGTTGARLHLDVWTRFDGPATVYHEDPALGPAEGRPAETAMMGDIVHLPEGGVTLHIEVLGSAPIERLDVFNGLEHLETIRPYGADKLEHLPLSLNRILGIPLFKGM